jgi:putative thiamine transport system permease protein
MTDRLAAAAPTAPLRRPRLLPWAPSLTLLLLAGPVLAGTLGVLLPAFGWFPPLGGTALSLAPWRDLIAWPGLAAALRLTVTTALLSTILSLASALLIVAAWQGTAAFRLIERALSPLLSVPHAAAAFGLAFLIAPSGWVMRWLSPWATGLERPPDVLMVGDPWGLSLVAGLVIKEPPFLLLMILAALP